MKEEKWIRGKNGNYVDFFNPGRSIVKISKESAGTMLHWVEVNNVQVTSATTDADQAYSDLSLIAGSLDVKVCKDIVLEDQELDMFCN